jgi:competence protein ComGC
MRGIISVLVLLIVSAAHAQLPADQLKFVDSVENLVNSNLKKYTLKKDTGRIVVSKTQTASYQKQFYLDRKTNSLYLVTYLKLFSNGVLINDTYYYLHNKPLSAYRLKQAKHKTPQEEAYYFYNDQTYRHNDSTILHRTNEIRSSAESLLAEFKKLK